MRIIKELTYSWQKLAMLGLGFLAGVIAAVWCEPRRESQQNPQLKSQEALLVLSDKYVQWSKDDMKQGDSVHLVHLQRAHSLKQACRYNQSVLKLRFKAELSLLAFQAADLALLKQLHSLPATRLKSFAIIAAKGNDVPKLCFLKDGVTYAH